MGRIPFGPRCGSLPHRGGVLSFGVFDFQWSSLGVTARRASPSANSFLRPPQTGKPSFPAFRINSFQAIWTIFIFALKHDSKRRRLVVKPNYGEERAVPPNYYCLGLTPPPFCHWESEQPRTQLLSGAHVHGGLSGCMIFF